MRAKRHPLIPAILNNDYQAAKQLLRDMTASELAEIRVSPLNALADHEFDYTKMPFLVWAVIAADANIFKRLLNLTDDVNPRFIQQDENVDIPLSFAIRFLHLPNAYDNAIALIYDLRTNVNWTTGESIILSLCFDYDAADPIETHKHINAMALLETLLKERTTVNVNAPHLSDGTTAIMAAARFGYADAVRMLLAHPKIDTTLKDVWGHDVYFHGKSNPVIKHMLRDHKQRFMDQEPLRKNAVLPATFDIAVDLFSDAKSSTEEDDAEKARNAPYPRSTLRSFLPLMNPASANWRPQAGLKLVESGRILEPLDFNNKSLGALKFSPMGQHDYDMRSFLGSDISYGHELIHMLKTAHTMYSAVDESEFNVDKALLVSARQTYIVPMLQALRDMLRYPEAINSFLTRKYTLREWVYMLGYCQGKLPQTEAATLYHKQGGYPLLYILYDNVVADGSVIKLVGWVRSMIGAAKSDTVRESIGPHMLSLFISALEQKRNGPIHYIMMDSLKGTDKVLRKISQETQEDLILYKFTDKTVPAWYTGSDSDCLVVTDALRNYYKQALTAVKESKSKRSKVGFCISCHVGEAYRPLYRPEGGEKEHVFCGEECYKHYFDGHYLH